MLVWPMDDMGKRLAQIKERISAAAIRAGRDPASVELMAVTKTRAKAEIDMALKHGITLLGENRVQEAQAKYQGKGEGYRLHLIGHLQSNKAKFVPGFFDCVESVDKIETAELLDRRCEQHGSKLRVLFEYNTSGEESKSGFESVDKLRKAIVRTRQLKNLELNGLMTIAPFTDDEEKIRGAFRMLREIFNQARELADASTFTTLSMGMSSDFEIAIEEGATRVRVGTALFGSRDG